MRTWIITEQVKHALALMHDNPVLIYDIRHEVVEEADHGMNRIGAVTVENHIPWLYIAIAHKAG